MSDTETDTPMEALVKAHRKEKKELQAKIQSLKKTATKGDKKKKKEVTEEIAKLESSLDEKHQREILELDTEKLSLNCEGEDPEAGSSSAVQESEPIEENKEMRVSKAQKRRDKKAEKEKQRLEEIEKQDEENLLGKRNLEQEAISKILESRGLKLYEIPSDGDCMFAAIAHQLRGAGVESSVGELRERTAGQLEKESEQYLPFLSLSQPEFTAYCFKMAKTAAWGGQVELLALSRLLSRPIEVIQAEGPSMVMGEDIRGQTSLILTYHRHMFGLGEHYNSVAVL